MSKLILFHGYPLTPKAKIALEALEIESNRHGLELTIQKAFGTTLHLSETYAFVKSKISHYGFVPDSDIPNCYHFIGLSDHRR